MSYNRWKAILTKDCLEYCTYVVRENEATFYKEAGIDNLLVIPIGAVNGFMSTLYWIINNTPEDVIFIADDDINKFLYRTQDIQNIEDKLGNPDKETTTSEIERIAQLIVDLGIGLAFDQPNKALYAYDREFAFKGMPGHVRWINKTALKAKFNPEDSASSDVDMMMQELLINRIVLQPKYFVSNGLIDKNEGKRDSRSVFKNLTYDLKYKWGKYYSFDYKRNIAKINVSR